MAALSLSLSSAALAQEETPKAPAPETAETNSKKDSRAHLQAAQEETKAAARAAAEEARQAAREAREAARKQMQETREQTQEAMREAREAAREAGNEARETLGAARDKAREAMRAARDSLREAMLAAAKRLEDDSAQRPPDTAADQRRRDEARRRRFEELRDELNAPPGHAAAITEPLQRELRTHSRRVARLVRIRALAEKKQDQKTLERCDALLEKEQARHEARLDVLFAAKEPTP
jgi:hypothetical protein